MYLGVLIVFAKIVRCEQNLVNGVRLISCQKSECFILVMKHMRVCGAKETANKYRRVVKHGIRTKTNRYQLANSYS